jgi:hypothetical protein
VLTADIHQQFVRACIKTVPRNVYIGSSGTPIFDGIRRTLLNPLFHGRSCERPFLIPPNPHAQALALVLAQFSQ